MPVFDVILLEDIVDTGATLEKVMHIVQTAGAKTVRIASLLMKPSVFDKNYPVDLLMRIAVLVARTHQKKCNN